MSLNVKASTVMLLLFATVLSFSTVTVVAVGAQANDDRVGSNRGQSYQLSCSGCPSSAWNCTCN
jgi:hypothetical protein